VLTEVAFKVLPETEARATVMIDGLSEHQAVEAMAVALGSPFEVTGAAHLPGSDPVTMLRLEGFAASVQYRVGRLSELMAPFGAVRAETDPEKVQDAWRQVRDVMPFAEKPGDVWRVSVKPTDGPDIAARAGGETFFDWGGGLVWALVPEGTDLRERLGAFAGHATLVRAAEETRARIAPFQPEPAPIAALSEGLRKQFDPRGILNPGLMSA
jgi:glycolate oxidase FAD binding subunit